MAVGHCLTVEWVLTKKTVFDGFGDACKYAIVPCSLGTMLGCARDANPALFKYKKFRKKSEEGKNNGFISPILNNVFNVFNNVSQ